ncbi:hypothetical protein SALBM217S_01363 [Streptomyces griseoloalbus]
MERSTLRTSTPSGTVSTVGAKFRMECHAGGHEPVADLLGRAGRGGDDAMDTPLSRMIVSSSSVCCTGMPATGFPAIAGSASISAATRKPRRRTLRSWPGRRQVTDTDDHNRPVLGEAEFAGDLVHEILDVVADAPGAVGTQVGEVLAQLRGVHTRGGRQLLRGDRGHRALGERGQGAEVQRKPGDGGLGNPSATGRRSVSSASCHGAPAGRAGLQAVIRPRTAPSNAGYVFVNACTKIVSDLPGQRDRGHAPPARTEGTGAPAPPFLCFQGQNRTLSSVNPAPETRTPSILSEFPPD